MLSAPLIKPHTISPKAKPSMASTPTPSPTPPQGPQPQPQLLTIKAAARKLPVKRKSPDTPSHSSPVPNSIPKLETVDEEDLEDAAGDDLKPSPFKYHRIWLELDEIRFLHGLLDCSTDGFVFPRDLHLFYDRFSQSMPQPYTKSQLSEKLRRLRKKFRVISNRISRGLDPSLLTPHDSALFNLSKQLWHPSYVSSSPFQSNKQKSSEVTVRVGFSPATAVLDPSSFNINDANTVEEDTELNLESNLRSGQKHGLPTGDDFGGFSSSGDGGLGRFSAKTIMDVFDRSLKELTMTLARRGLLYPDQSSTSTTAGWSKQGEAVDFEKRWRQQRAAELDVLVRRFRLVLENDNRWTMSAPRPL
ncbi:probable transcription factor At5g28040 [Macadamia integrifolia]|uniref:probable transcription factor At5g28040 n=1 Tax=Macadamia integrifolia TaxID=60698 RepID=UPI001C4E9052|nr:probable transcription factor At5g28040 [Macadamia integrifolia]